MIDKSLFIHKDEEHRLEDLKNAITLDEEVMYYYKNYTEKMKYPDLLGKTLKVSDNQVPLVSDIVKRIASILNMDAVDVYIFEDFYYGAESKGADKFWVEISAKTVTDFSENELTFLLAKEMCSIKLGHTYYFTLINELLDLVSSGLPILGADSLTKYWKGVMCKWSRVANYTSDCCGYVVCGDLSASINTVLKLILNNTYMASQVNLAQYIKQAEGINLLDDKVYSFTKLDEMIPYGPFRVKNLISYASSKRGLEAYARLHKRESR